MKSYWKNIRISPKKIRVIAEIIRWMNVQDALNFLKFAPKKWADILYKVLHSAVANAENNDAQKAEKLCVWTVNISKGVVYKRGQSISRGRMHSIKKRTSNILLELEAK
jgi:large subunit ribosomal protein L22